MFAINSGSIKKFVASDKKKLNAHIGVTFDKFGYVDFVPDANINRDSGILVPEGSVFSDLSIIGKNNAHLVATFPQLPRQRGHDID